MTIAILIGNPPPFPLKIEFGPRLNCTFFSGEVQPANVGHRSLQQAYPGDLIFSSQIRRLPSESSCQVS